VDNPFLWKTKGEVVKVITDAGCGKLIEYSRSCAHTWETTNEHSHCGVCSQCIDRRFGVIAAKAEDFDPLKQYRLDIFTQSRPTDADKIMGAAYLEKAIKCRTLADVGQFIEENPEVLRVLNYVEGNRTNAALRILDLHKRHAKEVTDALKVMVTKHSTEIIERTLPPDSLLLTVTESAMPVLMPAVPIQIIAPAAAGNGESAPNTEAILKEIHQEIAAVRTDFQDMKMVKERLAKMQGEKLFAFTDKIDAPSFRIFCAVLANGDVAKASRALNESDSTLRTRMAEWDKRGPAYEVLGELVRWRKEMGRKETVTLPESILQNTAPSADFAGVLSDVLDEVLAMNDGNWSEKADALAELLRPYVPR